MRDGQAQQFERDRRADENHLPVERKRAEQPPRRLVQLGHEERREPPDLVLRADLAEPAAREAAADREGQRGPLVGEERRHADRGADERAGIRTGNQSGQKRARQRQIGRVVVQQQAAGHADDQRHAQPGGKHQPLGPVALFSEENPPEPAKADEHDRQRGGDRQLDDQCRREELLDGQRPGLLIHEASPQL